VEVAAHQHLKRLFVRLAGDRDVVERARCGEQLGGELPLRRLLRQLLQISSTGSSRGSAATAVAGAGEAAAPAKLLAAASAFDDVAITGKTNEEALSGADAQQPPRAPVMQALAQAQGSSAQGLKVVMASVGSSAPARCSPPTCIPAAARC